MKNYKKVLNILFLKKKLYLELLILIILDIFVALLQPVLWGYLITDLIALRDQEGIVIIILLFFVYLMSTLLSFGKGKKETEIKCVVGFELKEKLYLLLLNAKACEQRKMQTGEFVSTLEYDVDEITNVCASQIVNLIVESFKVVVILILSFAISWKLTLVSVFVFPLNLLFFYSLGNRINENEKILRENIDEYYSKTQEYFNGIKGIKCMGAKEKIKSILMEIIEINKIYGVKNGKLTSMGTSFVGLMDFVSLIIIYSFGYYLVRKQELNVELFIAYTSYSATLSAALMSVLEFNPVLQRIKVSLKRIEDLITDLEKNAENWGNKIVNDIYKPIKIENVCFSYGDKEVLKNINIIFPQTGVVALAGKNGCGKTTFIEILLRINYPNRGKIYLDGIENTEIEEKCFRKIFGAYLQNDFLFNMTIRENIMLANPSVTDDEIMYWAKKIGIYKKISELPLGLDYIVNENSKNFSGGEIQKICLLRTIIQNTRVLIFDEPMSSMDNISKKLFRKVMKELSMDKLIIIVSHDDKDFEMADVKYLLKDGNIEFLNTPLLIQD